MCLTTFMCMSFICVCFFKAFLWAVLFTCNGILVGFLDTLLHSKFKIF